jgi:eukaryotic-like serine/threonine-protein kinase
MSTSESSVSAGSVGQWDVAVLEKLEAELTLYMGPIAKWLVRRDAGKHTSPDALIASLATSIVIAERRDAFLSAARAHVKVPREIPSTRHQESPLRTVGDRGLALPPEEIERAQQLLAIHIGPIAQIVVTRAASLNLDRAEFYRRIVEEIESAEGRERFLGEVGVVL